MGFYIVFGPDPQVEEPGAWDGFSFWLLITYMSVVTFVLFPVTIYYARKYEPLRIKSVYKLCVSLFISFIHVGALFVGNEQSLTSKDLAKSNCALWNIWFLYPLGLNGWFLMMAERTITYSFFLKKKDDVSVLYNHDNVDGGYSNGDSRDFMYDVNPKKISIFSVKNRVGRLLFKFLIILFITMPIFIIALLDTLLEQSVFDVETNTCTTALPIKLLILGWVFFIFLFQILLNKWVNSRISFIYLNETREVRDILVCGFMAFFIFLLIHFSGSQNLAKWRTIQLCSLLFMYLFSFMRIVYVPLKHAILKDQRYVDEFRRSLDPLNQMKKINSFSEMINTQNLPLIDDFNNYCQNGHVFYINGVVSLDRGTQKVGPLNGAKYLKVINAIDTLKRSNNLTVMHCEDLLKRYFLDYSSDEYVFVRTDVIYNARQMIKQVSLSTSPTTSFGGNNNDDNNNKKMIQHVPEKFCDILKIDLWLVLDGQYFDGYKKTRMRDFLESQKSSQYLPDINNHRHHNINNNPDQKMSLDTNLMEKYDLLLSEKYLFRHEKMTD